MSQKQTFFCPEWLQDAAYKDVIKADPNNKRVALCLVCDGKSRTIQLSNMGKQALKSHCSGKKHIQRVHDRNTSLGIGIFAASTSTAVSDWSHASYSAFTLPSQHMPRRSRSHWRSVPSVGTRETTAGMTPGVGRLCTASLFPSLSLVARSVDGRREGAT